MKKICVALIALVASTNYGMHDNDMFRKKLYAARSLVAQETHQQFHISPYATSSLCHTIEELKTRLENTDNNRLQHIKLANTICDLTEVFDEHFKRHQTALLTPYVTTLPRTQQKSTYLLLRNGNQNSNPQCAIIEHSCPTNNYYYSSVTGVTKTSFELATTPVNRAYYDTSRKETLLLPIHHDNNTVYVGDQHHNPFFQVETLSSAGTIKASYILGKKLACITHTHDDTYTLHTFLFPSFSVPYNLLYTVGTSTSKLLARTIAYAPRNSIPSLEQLCLPAVARMIAKAPPNLSSSAVRLMSACDEHPFQESIFPSIAAHYLDFVKDYAIQESLSTKESTAFLLNTQVVSPYHKENKNQFSDYMSKLISNQQWWLEYLTIPSKRIFLSYALNRFLNAQEGRIILPLPCDTGSRYLLQHGNNAPFYTILHDKVHNNCYYFAAKHAFLRVDINGNRINTFYEYENDHYKNHITRSFALSQPNAPLLLAISPDGSYLHTCVSCPCGSHVTSPLPISAIQSFFSEGSIEKYVHAPTGRRATCLLPSLTEMHKCRISYDHSHTTHNAARTFYATLTNDGTTIDVYGKDDTHVHRLGLPETDANEFTEALFFLGNDTHIACLKHHLNAQKQTVHTLYSFDLTQAPYTPKTCSDMPLIAAWAYLSKEHPQTISNSHARKTEEKYTQPTVKQIAHTLKSLTIGK